MLNKWIYICISKHNLNREKQIILLMIIVLLIIPNGKGWHCLKVKTLYALLRGILSKHVGDFCLNCLHTFRRKKIDSQKNVYENVFVVL